MASQGLIRLTRNKLSQEWAQEGAQLGTEGPWGRFCSKLAASQWVQTEPFRAKGGRMLASVSTVPSKGELLSK